MSVAVKANVPHKDKVKAMMKESASPTKGAKKEDSVSKVLTYEIKGTPSPPSKVSRTATAHDIDVDAIIQDIDEEAKRLPNRTDEDYRIRAQRIQVDVEVRRRKEMVDQLYQTSGEESGGRSSTAQLRALHQRLLVSEQSEEAAIANALYAKAEADKIIRQQRDVVEQLRIKAVGDEVEVRNARMEVERSNRASAARGPFRRKRTAFECGTT